MAAAVRGDSVAQSSSALADNVITPLLIKAGMEMRSAVVFFSLIGGLAAFGAIGLIVGRWLSPCSWRSCASIAVTSSCSPTPGVNARAVLNRTRRIRCRTR